MREDLIFSYERENRAVVDDHVSGQGCSVYMDRTRLADAAAMMLEAGYALDDITLLDVSEGIQGQYRFTHWDKQDRVTIRTIAPHDEACFPSIAGVYPGADWHERENMDFYPVNYEDHPNPTPLLLPDDMAEEHPLEKREKDRVSYFDIVPGQKFIECDSDHMLCSCALNLHSAKKDEFPLRCIPELRFKQPDMPANMRLEVEDGDFYSKHFETTYSDDRLVLNMGPQHPSTHGVLRVVLELDGEYVIRAEPVLGYIHRMHEKMGEVKTFHQYLPNMGRVDYLHALAWNHAYCLAVEKLADIEVPRRAELIRVITNELNRLSSHLLWWGAYLLDLGAFTPIMYAFEDRERIMDLLQVITGSRLTYCYFVFGGVTCDVPGDFAERTRSIVHTLRDRLPMFTALVTENLILRKRVEDIGVIDPSMCRRYGATGPVLRGAGVAYDVRMNSPYSVYDELDFEIPVYDGHDAMSRYMVRMDEMAESIKIIEQALDLLDGADDGHIIKKAPNAGFTPPSGEAYAAVEGARGKIGVYVASDGGKKPYRVKLRAPGFSNLSLFAECAQGTLLADAVSILGSLDLVIPEIDR